MGTCDPIALYAARAHVEGVPTGAGPSLQRHKILLRGLVNCQSHTSTLRQSKDRRSSAKGLISQGCLLHLRAWFKTAQS